MSSVSTGTVMAPRSTASSPVQSFETGFGRVSCDPQAVRLGELFVTDDGVEVEVIGLEPLAFAEAPEEDEDWGE
jgi:lysine biosynthesis protein LysW